MTLVVVGTLAIVAAVIFIGVKVDRKVGLLPRREKLVSVEVYRRKHSGHRGADYAAGEAPATAIRARGAQLDKLRTSRRCPTCREAVAAATADDDHVRYGDGELLVLHLKCPKCGETRSLYVDVSA